MDTNTNTPKWFHRLLTTLGHAPLLSVGPIFPNTHPALSALVIEQAEQDCRAKVLV